MKDVIRILADVARCVDGNRVAKSLFNVNRLLKSQLKFGFVSGLIVQSLEKKMMFTSIAMYLLTDVPSLYTTAGRCVCQLLITRRNDCF
jgi:hypothetical protein